MAADSRNVKHKRRQRRNISLLTRELRRVQQAHVKAMATLFAILAQKGDVTITKGTIDQVVDKLTQLQYKTAPGALDGEYVISLVEATPEGDAAAPSAPSAPSKGGLTITRLPDDPSDDVPVPTAEAIAEENTARLAATDEQILAHQDQEATE